MPSHPRTLVLATALLALVTGCEPAPTADVILRGGTVYDGSGAAPTVGDVAIRRYRMHRPG